MTHPENLPFSPVDHVDDLLALHAAGIVTVAEQERVDAHLLGCAACRAAMRVYEETLTALHGIGPQRDPPERLRHALMATTEPVAVPRLAPSARRQPQRFTFALVGAGVAAGLVMGLGIGLSLAVVQLRNDVRESGASIDQLEALVRQERLVSYLAAAPETAVIVLDTPPESPDPMDGAYAMLMSPPNGRFAVLVAGGMAALPSGRAYQLWVVTEGERMDGGVFTVDETGWGQVQVRPSTPMAHIERVGITVEPASGSTGPTTSAVLLWAE